MLLTAEQPLVLSAIECLLGGTADRPPKERRFSEIDWRLTQRFVESIVNQLSIVWQDLGGLTLAIEDIDLHNDASQVAAVSEPTFVVMIECRMNKQSSAMALMIPWAAIEPVSDRIAGREAPRRPRGPALLRDRASAVRCTGHAARGGRVGATFRFRTYSR